MLTEFVTSWFRSRPQPRFHVREFHNWSELESQRNIWQSLYQQTPAASFFQTWQWFETYWRHFGGEQQLRVLIVEETNGSAIGLVPLTLRTRTSPIGTVRRIGFPLDNWGTQYGPLGDRPKATLTAAFTYLRERRREWDVIDLRWVTPELCPEFVEAWRAAGMHFQQKLWCRTERIDLSRGWTDYWNTRTSKWRNNQRRSDKSLAKLGTVRIEHFRPDPGSVDTRDDLLDQCEQIAATSWQGACTTGNTLSHPAVRSFLRDVHAAAVKSGSVHLSLLWIANRPAAFTYNYLASGTIFGLRMGYDPEFQSAGPGAVLMRETIRECCDRGDHTFDLGESPSPYKRHLANQHFESFRFCHYSSASPLGQALRFKGWLANSVGK